MLRLFLQLVTRFFRSRRDLLLENLALRQPLMVLRRRKPRPVWSNNSNASCGLAFVVLEQTTESFSASNRPLFLFCRSHRRRKKTASCSSPDDFVPGDIG